MDDLHRLHTLEDELEEEFKSKRQVMSFDSYFQEFCKQPATHLRTSAQYARDCLDYFGTYDVMRAGSKVTRFRLFDCPWDDGRHRVIGQEEAQKLFYRQLKNFVRDGRVTQLVLLHGPNGSAKSSFIQCLSHGMEHYSTLDEGAVYRFNWVFPSRSISKKKLGFGDNAERGRQISYAELDEDEVDARIPGDLMDHPILLLPKEKRAKLISGLIADGRMSADHPVGEYLLEGNLSPRSRKIADTLLNAYMGNFERMLMHVQIERFFFSKRYRSGLVTVEPQMHVDATVRQVTMDQGLQSLPASLRHLSLFQPQGDLVDANRGLIEYNDLLKKPVDAYKYLLATCEKGTVSLPEAILHLDTVFVASSNEAHLNAFKEYPDFPSFKGRMALIKMPYIRDCTLESEIYDDLLRLHGLSSQVVPHTTFVLGLWAVLTRLKRPNPDGYHDTIRDTLKKLKPLEKAELIAGLKEPAGLTREQSKELRASLQKLLDEGQETRSYEGSRGASPREIKDIMLNALQNDKFYGLSPLAVFDELRELVKLKSVYDFLKVEPDQGYHDCRAMIDTVMDRYFDKLNSDVQVAMGLVSTTQYEELFGRYIQNVKSSVKGEKVYNASTGRSEALDGKLMGELEAIWKPSVDEEEFRSGILSRIAAWRIDNPGEPIDYTQLFPDLLKELSDDYFNKQKKTIKYYGEAVLSVFAEEVGQDTGLPNINTETREKAMETIAMMVDDQHYPRPAIPEVLAALLKHCY
jgi:serine protein kinase